MKKLLTVLFCLLVFTSVSFAQCGVTSPSFGDPREKTERIMSGEFGQPESKTKIATIWNITQKGGNLSHVNALFRNDRFIGFLIITTMEATTDNARIMLGMFDKVEEITLKEGFVFSKDAKDKKGTVETVYREYECKVDKRVKCTITLGKDESRGVFSFDHMTFFEGEFK